LDIFRMTRNRLNKSSFPSFSMNQNQNTSFRSFGFSFGSAGACIRYARTGFFFGASAAGLPSSRTSGSRSSTKVTSSALIGALSLINGSEW